MVETVDLVVIGAGVVGLAVARSLAKAGRDVILVEKNSAIGEETSSRNSEVIHAGIQYKPGGVRAELAVRGRDMLYAFCQSHGVAHQRCGKLLVATDKNDVERLAPLMARAAENGVDDLQIIDGDKARTIEPKIKCDAAIVSPSSGIVDSHGLMLALIGEFEDAGGVLALNAPVIKGEVVDNGVDLTVGGAEPIALRATQVVNCAGLWADRVARSIDGVPEDTIPRLQYARGIYFSITGPAPFSRLIYPLPSPDSQGIHYTCDLGGQGRLGPDIEFIASNIDYAVDESRASLFAKAAKAFWPEAAVDRLVPGYAGIRPKLKGPGEEGDFLFSSSDIHGIPGYLALYGIESPGLTTCLAIAERAAKIVG